MRHINIGPGGSEVWALGLVSGGEKSLSLCVGVRRNNLVVPGEAAVVKALTKKYDVGEEVVHGENDHGWQDALENAADDIEQVT